MSSKYTDLVLRNRYFVVLDLLIFVVSGILSFIIRLETNDLRPLLLGIGLFLAIALPAKLILFYANGIYRQYWSHAGPNELLLAAFACLTAGSMLCLAVLAGPLIWSDYRSIIPRSIPLIDTLVTAALVITSRFGPRAWITLERRRKHQQLTGRLTAKRTLILGAGSTGIRVVEALDHTASSLLAVGFLDDDPRKIGRYIRGLKVLGNLGHLRDAITTYHISQVVIALPSAPNKLVRDIVRICQETGVQHRIMPGAYELASGQISVNALRPVAIDDLLRRAPIELNLDDIHHLIRGRRVLVTGAGGSIGSELSRQIAGHEPDLLLLVGHGENSLFLTEARLKTEFPQLRYALILADIRDCQRMERMFAQWQPDLVFHAAAHKHVPMLETNVVEAVLNNVVGTRNMVSLCNRFGVQRLVMISTDKAVKPTSVMGMTKRAAELVMLHAAQTQPGRFAVVRFGNVLGSRGSVVPTFQQQIAQGGPVTITSEKMTRFFMSIPEAVLLVLKASVLAQDGSLFVLNMGEPVRILDLAQDLIRLSGAEPGRDIDIKVTGIRPGEKLYEELFWDFEAYQAIEQAAIFALTPSAEHQACLANAVPRLIAALVQAAEAGDEQETRALLKKTAFAVTAPTRKFHSAEKHSELVIALPHLTPTPNGNGHGTGNGNGHGGPAQLEESSI